MRRLLLFLAIVWSLGAAFVGMESAFFWLFDIAVSRGVVNVP
jgi:hypothetical protein